MHKKANIRKGLTTLLIGETVLKRSKNTGQFLNIHII